MALSLPDEAIQAMEETHNPQWVVTAFYGATQTIPSSEYPAYESVPVTEDGQITFDADGQTQANGQLFLAYDADDLVPQSKTDPLAPFGQELAIVRRVAFANSTWDVPLGRFRIEEVPDTANLFRAYPAGDLDARLQALGWRAQLSITDLFDILQEDDFLAKTSPTNTASTWAEIQDLSPLPIVKSLPDQPVPSGIVYRSRTDAITQMMSNLGGEPHLTRLGALTARPKNNWLTATNTVAVVNGTVSVSGGMSNKLKNSVSVTNPSNATILGHKEITNPADPLRVDGPLRRRTQELSDPLMDTQAKADAAAATALARLSTQQSRVVKVACLPRPDLELGDYIQVNEFNGDGAKVAEWYGEVRHMDFSMRATDLMTFDLTVAEKR